MATRGAEKNNGIIATDVRAIANAHLLSQFTTQIVGIDLIFAGTYGIGMFRSSDSGQSWEKINNGLPALYKRSLAINAMVTFS